MNPSGLLHPVQGDVQQRWADHPALRGAFLGRSESAVLNHARLQPLPDHPPRGERAEHGQNVVVADEVERGRQICVQHPPAFRVWALGRLVDRRDRVMAATAGPKSVGPRLEPCLPLGLQRVHDPSLMGSVEKHRRTQNWLPQPAQRRPYASARTAPTGRDRTGPENPAANRPRAELPAELTTARRGHKTPGRDSPGFCVGGLCKV